MTRARSSARAWLVAALVGMAPAPAAAQGVQLWVGAGPTARLAPAPKGTGAIHGQAMLHLPVAVSPWAFRLEAGYAELPTPGGTVADTGRRSAWGGVAVAFDLWLPRGLPVRPYLVGGAALHDVRALAPRAEGDTVASTLPGLNAGAGLEFALGPLRLFGEARWHVLFRRGDELQFLPLAIGLRLGA